MLLILSLIGEFVIGLIEIKLKVITVLIFSWDKFISNPKIILLSIFSWDIFIINPNRSKCPSKCPSSSLSQYYNILIFFKCNICYIM